MNSYSELSPAGKKQKSTLQSYLELTKPGITLLVLFSMTIGFLLGSGGEISLSLLLHAVIGTWFIASGTAAHNQFIERDLDKKMLRTLRRPLPARKIAPQRALLFSISLMVIGFFYLLLLVNTLTGVISAITSFIYLVLYTPLKRISFLNVMVGAVAGALPPVGGWVAASGSIDNPVAWILFSIVFLWQVPHVVAIAWLCNDDYRNAGFRMLPQNDNKGIYTAITILFCLILLFPISYFLYSMGMSSLIYLTGAISSALLFLYYGFQFQLSRTKENARKVLYGSLIYLPTVWSFILVDIFYTWLI